MLDYLRRAACLFRFRESRVEVFGNYASVLAGNVGEVWE